MACGGPPRASAFAISVPPGPGPGCSEGSFRPLQSWRRGQGLLIKAIALPVDSQKLLPSRRIRSVAPSHITSETLSRSANAGSKPNRLAQRFC